MRIRDNDGAIIRTERLDGCPTNRQILAVDIVSDGGIRERRLEPGSACNVWGGSQRPCSPAGSYQMLGFLGSSALSGRNVTD
jgi:hypothetical protein